MRIGNSNPSDMSNPLELNNKTNSNLNNNVESLVNTRQANANETFLARGTGYYPANNSLEGGFVDRKGAPLHTLQDFLAGRAPYVSVAMDSKAFPYGTNLRIPELERKYGRPIDFRVVDTGGAFVGKGTSRIDICTANNAASLDSTINGPLHLEVVGKTGTGEKVDGRKSTTPATESTPSPIKGLPVKVMTPPEDKPLNLTSSMLRNGSNGKDVRQLQEALAKEGFNPGPKDGIFGPRTEAALKAFQRSRDIAVDGIFGPQTRGAFMNKTNSNLNLMPEGKTSDKPARRFPSAPSVTTGSANAGDGSKVLDNARAVLGKNIASLKYNGPLAAHLDKWPGNNVCCANFVSACLEKAGQIKHSEHNDSVKGLAKNLANDPNWAKTSLANAKPGDVVCFNVPGEGPMSHVAMFAGMKNGQPTFIGSNNVNADHSQRITEGHMGYPVGAVFHFKG